MNNFLKVFIAIIGATNAIFSIFIPSILGILVTQFIGGGWQSSIVMVVALISTLYRALHIGFSKYFLD